ncbi:MAG: hypothetical protein OQK04_03345 [Kangiellaceae bacterium]|nr:hypothetical protein [Kangiellaceae bacterium]MCW8997741.1 hypothetical protein [Kangiellaceae bacterium]
MKKFAIIIAITLFYAPLSWAESFQLSGKKITEIHVYSTSASIKFTPADSANYGCSGNSQGSSVIISWAGNEDMKAMYSTILAAYMAGKTVGFGVQGCLNGYFNETPLIYRVDLN